MSRKWQVFALEKVGCAGVGQAQVHVPGPVPGECFVGPAGAEACAADLSVVIDVLSFSTSVVIATTRGTTVFPCPWRDPRADSFAAEHDAVVAVGRLEAARDGAAPRPSLSPAGLLTADPVPRLVLPSPNGSTIASLLRDQGSQVAIGCLRNASAVAELAAGHLDTGRTVARNVSGSRERVAANRSAAARASGLMDSG